jgi:hypothetical protein
MSRLQGVSTAAAWAALPVVCLLTVPSLDASSSSAEGSKPSDAIGLSAFRDLASVLVGPRCLNCHVAGDSPLQGDDGQPHNMNVKRGVDGRGTPAMRCTNCHQETNSEFAHAPPGVPDWRLPEAKTPMAWQGLSIGEFCRTLKDRSKNGGRSLTSLLQHVKSDPIVNWGWNPGAERTRPPLSHQNFVDKFIAWMDSGAPCEP